MRSFTGEDWANATPERKAEMAGELAAEALASLTAAIKSDSPENVVKHYADDYAFWRSDEQRTRAEIRAAERKKDRTK